MRRPHDGSVPIIRDEDGTTETVVRLFIRRLDFILFGPIRVGPRENIGGTGVGDGIGAYNRILIIRPHDGGVTILRDGDGITKTVTRLFI